MHKYIYILIIFIFRNNASYTQEEFYVVNAKDGLRLRESRSVNSKILRGIPYGECVKVVAKDKSEINGFVWYKVETDNKVGFVASQYLTPKPRCVYNNSTKITTTNNYAHIPCEIAEVTSNKLNLRSNPDPTNSNNILSILKRGDRVIISRKPAVYQKGYLWYFVSVNQMYGYVASEFLTCVTSNKPNSDKRKEANLAFWNRGDSIADALWKKLDKHVLESTFCSDLVANWFAQASKQLKRLPKSELLYPEIIEDVNRKAEYLDLVHNTIKGSFARYGEKALRVLVIKAIDNFDLQKFKILMRKWNVVPTVVWLEDEALKSMEDHLKSVNEKERQTINYVRKRYGMDLNPW